MATYVAHERIGYYPRDVKMCIDKRLQSHSGAQCGVVISGSEILFYSYTTLAACIDKDGFLKIYCTYSRTTLTHLRWFIHEYCPKVGYMHFDLLRDMCQHHIALNINTGEMKCFK